MADRINGGDGTGRALVVVAPDARIARARPMAGFVTQLIACQRRLPAYRVARRIDPETAVSRYGARLVQPPKTLDRDA